MSEEKVPAIGDQRVAISNFFTKHLQNLSDQNIAAISDEVDVLHEALHKNKKRKA